MISLNPERRKEGKSSKVQRCNTYKWRGVSSMDGAAENRWRNAGYIHVTFRGNGKGIVRGSLAGLCWQLGHMLARRVIRNLRDILRRRAFRWGDGGGFDADGFSGFVRARDHGFLG